MKKLAIKQLLLWSHKTHCKQDQGVKKFSEIKPLVLTHARQSQVTTIAVKQLLLWSHKKECKQYQGVKI